MRVICMNELEGADKELLRIRRTSINLMFGSWCLWIRQVRPVASMTPGVRRLGSAYVKSHIELDGKCPLIAGRL